MKSKTTKQKLIAMIKDAKANHLYGIDYAPPGSKQTGTHFKIFGGGAIYGIRWLWEWDNENAITSIETNSVGVFENEADCKENLCDWLGV